MIYDAYMQYCRINKLERLQELGLEGKEKKTEDQGEDELVALNLVPAKSSENQGKKKSQSSFNKCLKVMERMLV